jgi:hypothetical protein
MRRKLVFVGSLLLMLAVAGSVQAEGWGWPNLNPFAAKKTSSYRVNDSKSSSWLPSWGKPVAPQRGPTTWQKVQAAPGKMYTKTKETLSPLNPFKTQPTRTSSFMGAKKQEEESYGFWPDWMTVEEKEESKPISVSDWLNAKKPGDE